MADLDSRLNALAARAKAGDQEAFGEIFDLISEAIFRFIHARISDRETAKDLTSQVFLEAWQALGRFDTARRFRPWLYTIARYHLIDHFRSHKATVSLDAVMDRPSSTNIQGDVDRKSDTEALLSKLARLPELYQTVIRLRFLEELEYPEIAAITGKTENSLRVIVNRGLAKLRQQFQTVNDE